MKTTMQRRQNGAILLGDRTSPSAAFRMSELIATDPMAKRHLLSGANAANVDATIQRLLDDAQERCRVPADVYGRWLSEFLSSQGPSAHLMRNAAHLMGPGPADVHIPTIDPGIFVLHENRDLIADMVSPVVSASRMSNYIQQAPAATMQNIANTRIAGSRATPNQIAWSVDNTLSYSCVPLGLVDYIAQETLDNADSSALKTTALYMAVLKSFMDLAREFGVAALAFAAASYGSNTTALAGADRWDNASSDPIAQLLQYKEAVLTKVNTLVLGGQVWNALQTNPAVKGYITGRAGTINGPIPMQVMMDTIAQLVGVEKVLVGGARYNSAAEGATAVSAYVWGKSAALLRVEPNPDPIMTSTFMYTYRFGGRAYRNEIIPDRLGGAMGGQYIKLSTIEDDVVIGGANTGYLLTTVIS